MKNQLLLLGIAGASAVFTSLPSQAAIVLSENFENRAAVEARLASGTVFFQQGAAGPSSRYFELSNDVDPAILNPTLGTNNATNYLTGQNMDIAPFSTTAPAQLDFTVDVTGNSDLRLSIDLAGLTSPEPENYVRAFTDDDGDGIFETPVFNFQGTGNQPYTETTTGEQLTAEFATFDDFVLNNPTQGSTLRVRLELYNDTDSQNEASGVDNLVITGVIPEPSSIAVLAGAVAMLGIARRRRS